MYDDTKLVCILSSAASCGVHFFLLIGVAYNTHYTNVYKWPSRPQVPPHALPPPSHTQFISIYFHSDYYYPIYNVIYSQVLLSTVPNRWNTIEFNYYGFIPNKIHFIRCEKRKTFCKIILFFFFIYLRHFN